MNQAVVEQKVTDDSLKATIDRMPDVEPAVKAFTDVRKTLSLLSDVGIGHMRPWRSDELGYMSSTPYYGSGLRAKTDSLRIVFCGSRYPSAEGLLTLIVRVISSLLRVSV